jgi:tetratricopeptide (TPR) repeat protein
MYDAEHGPLGRAVYWLAPVVWLALATTAAAAAGKLGGSNWKHKRTAAALLVLAASAKLFSDAKGVLESRATMWAEAARREPGNDRAVSELAAPLVRKRKPGEVRKLADKCLAARPDSCPCLELRATAGLQSKAFADAATDARAAVDKCPNRPAAYVSLAEALVLTGDLAGAEQAATKGLELGGDAGRLKYSRALAFERKGQLDEAAAEAEAAANAGGGRDARLLAGAVAIARNDLDGAQRWLDPLVAEDPEDVEALYDRALVSDKRGDFNGARQRYLAVLKLDPKHADSRYNLALLTHRAGARDEARHHAARFGEIAPRDPRRHTLAATVGLEAR